MVNYGGHKEAVYERAVLWVLDKDNVRYESQKKFIITYKGKSVGSYYPDLMLAEGKVLVDFKAAPAIMPLHKGQAISYLGVTGAELGFLINFGANASDSRQPPYGSPYPRHWLSAPNLPARQSHRTRPRRHQHPLPQNPPAPF